VITRDSRQVEAVQDGGPRREELPGGGLLPGLHLVVDGVRERHLGDLSRKIRLLGGPIAERRAELREGVDDEPVSTGGGSGRHWVVTTPSVPIRMPWQSTDATAAGAKLVIEVKLIPGMAAVFYAELVAGEARGAVNYDAAVIDGDLLVIESL